MFFISSNFIVKIGLKYTVPNYKMIINKPAYKINTQSEQCFYLAFADRYIYLSTITSQINYGKFTDHSGKP